MRRGIVLCPHYGGKEVAHELCRSLMGAVVMAPSRPRTCWSEATLL